MDIASRRKIKKEEGQTKGLIKDNTPNKSAKQWTPSSAEKPNPKRINKLNNMEMNQMTKVREGTSNPPPPDPPINPLVFDLAVMEQRLIASYQENIKAEVSNAIANYQENIKTEVSNAIKPLQESIDVLLASKKKTEEIQGEVKKLKHENKAMTHRCNIMERENKTLKNRLNDIENKLLENNIVMHGVEETLKESELQRKRKVKAMISHTVNRSTVAERMEVVENIPIEWTERLGRYNEQRSRPISIKSNRQDCDLLLQHKKHFPDGVYVDREYCVETEKEHQYLRPILQKARKFEDLRGSCRMDGSTLLIQGKKYTRTNVHQLPEKISGFNCTSKSDDETICFFGELNPFSNFHPCSFEVAGIKYHSSEQFIQHMKARFFEDKKSAEAILHAPTPRECKQLSKGIVNYNYDSWANMAKELCKPGISAKFFQNPDLAKMFEVTGNKSLVEACYKKLWGTGIPLHHPDCLNQEKWYNKGIMSEMLSEIRAELNGIRCDNEEEVKSTDMVTDL